MNAITLNLLAEEELAHQQRARDPFKAAVAIGVGLVTLVIGLGVFSSIRASSRRTAVNELQSKLDRLVSAGVVAGEGAYRDMERIAADARRVNQARVLCAPELALLKDLVPASVELGRIQFTVSLEAESVPPPASDPGAEPGGGKRVGGRIKSVERLVLQLDGRALADNPELEVNRFLETLRANQAFSAAVDTIRLRSIVRAAPIADATGAAQLPNAQFVIECQYKVRP